MLPNIITSVIPSFEAITTKHVIIIVVTLVDNPSTPSVKLTAFVVPSITNIAKIMYKDLGILTYIFKIGIYVSVPTCKTFFKYNMYISRVNKRKRNYGYACFSSRIK